MPGQDKRIFAAVKIHAADSFLSIYNRIKSSLKHERITWVNPENMHLTLKFFGETPLNKIPEIDKCLQASVSNFRAFDIEIKNTGMFGSRYQPRVLWFGIEDGGFLQKLFISISEELKSIGIYPDRQNFVAHLTIGRIKEIKDKHTYQRVLETYRQHNSGKQTLDELVLYESILRREGPEYVPLKRYAFAK